MATLNKNSSEDSQESSIQDKSQLSLSRCNSADSNAHLVLNACKTAQSKFSALPATKVNNQCNAAALAIHTNNALQNANDAHLKATVATTPAVPATPPPTPSPPSSPPTRCNLSKNQQQHHYSHCGQQPPALRIQLDCDGGILNTAFIDNAAAPCPIHCTLPRKKENATFAKTLPLPATKAKSHNLTKATNTNTGQEQQQQHEQQQHQQQQYNDVQFRRHSAYAKVYRDLVNDNKCNLNQCSKQQQQQQPRPASYIQTVVTKNGYVTTSVQHEPPELNHLQTNGNAKDIGQVNKKRSWLKSQK